MSNSNYKIPGGTPADYLVHKLTGIATKNSIPLRGKGSSEDAIPRKKISIVSERIFARDRETNQLFILKSVSGSDQEATLASTSYTGNKAELDVYYIFEPLITRNKFVSFTVTAGQKTNVNAADPFYGGNQLAIDVSVPASTTSSHEYPYIDVTKDRVLYSNAFNGQYVLLADGGYGSSMSTINPFHTTENPQHHQGYTGNFVFGSCATVINNNTILIGCPDGLYYAQMQGNTVVKTTLAVASNGLWNPIHLHTALNKADNTVGAIYMTAILNQRSAFQTFINSPGYATGHATKIVGTAGTTGSNQKATDYMGRSCVFKLPLSGNAVDGTQATIIYGQLGNEDDLDFQMQINSYNAGWGLTSVTDCNRDWIKYMSESNNKTYITTGSNIYSNGPSMDNFSFGLDSFWCMQPDGWNSLLFYKKTEEPFIQAYTDSGALVKNIPIYGERFALDAKRLRICGTTSKVESFFLGESVSAVPPASNSSSSYDCSNNSPFYMRGFYKVFHYGYLTKAKDKQFLVKSFIVNPWFSQYMTQRNYYMSTGGWFECTDLNPFTNCHGTSDNEPCWSTSQTLMNACSMYNPGITASGGGLIFGVNLYMKYWDNECCLGFDPQGGAGGSNYGGIGGGYTPGQTQLSCGPIMNPMFPHGVIARTFTLKKEKHRFLDLLCANPAYCNVNTTVSPRIPPGSFYSTLDDPSNDRDSTNLWNDKRMFGNYRGPQIGVADTDIVETPTGSGVTFLIKGKDDFVIQPKLKAFETVKSNQVQGTKTFAITSAETMSPYDFAIMRNYRLVSLVKKEYSCSGQSLRTYIEQQQGSGGGGGNIANDLTDLTHNHNMIWMTSLDWAFYAPVGMSDINPGDLSLYDGGRTLAGVYIYEGLSSVSAGSSALHENGLTAIFGGKDKHSSGFERIVIVRPVTFHFHMRARTKKCTEYMPSQTFSTLGPISIGGEVRETYIIAEK